MHLQAECSHSIARSLPLPTSSARDGSMGVDIEVRMGARLPILRAIGSILLAVGLILVLVALALFRGALFQ